MSVADGHAPIQRPDGVCEAHQYHAAQDWSTRRRHWTRLPAISTRVETCKLQKSLHRQTNLANNSPKAYLKKTGNTVILYINAKNRFCYEHLIMHVQTNFTEGLFVSCISRLASCCCFLSRPTSLRLLLCFFLPQTNFTEVTVVFLPTSDQLH